MKLLFSKSRLIGKFAFVSLISLFAMGVLMQKIVNPSSSQEGSVIKGQVVENLLSNDPKIRDAQVKTQCFIQGKFCHADLTKVTQEDRDKSFAGMTTTLFMYPLEHMPSSGIASISHAISQAGLTSEVQAVGTGHTVLLPFIDVWKQVRNVAYSVLVLIIIFESFALMFHSQVGSKDSIAIESLLPKIIAVMILIQFSFTIAGFIIDLMYIVSLGIFLVFAPLVTAIGISKQAFIDQYLFGGPADLNNAIFSALVDTQNSGLPAGVQILMKLKPELHQIINVLRLGSNAKDLIFLFGTETGTALTAVIGFMTLAKILEVTGLLGTAALGTPPGLLIAALTIIGGPIIVVSIFLFVSVLYVTWKVFITLLRSYIMVILLTIFSPVLILMDLVPGNSYGIKKWIKSLLSELVAFPVVFTLLLIILIFYSIGSNGSSTLALPFVVKLSNAITFVIGLIILSLTPKITEDIKNAIDRSMFTDIDKSLQANYHGTKSWITNSSSFVGKIMRGVANARRGPGP